MTGQDFFIATLALVTLAIHTLQAELSVIRFKLRIHRVVDISNRLAIFTKSLDFKVGAVLAIFAKE